MPLRIGGASKTTTKTDPPENVPEPETFNDGLPLPKILIFDLDYTLWPFWVDTHVTPPLKGQEGGLSVKDRYGEGFGFYSEVGGILDAARAKNIKIAAASRTSSPELAREMLRLLRIPRAAAAAAAAADGSSSSSSSEHAGKFFDYKEIYPGDKKTHMAQIKKNSGLEYADMLFFDDESRNKNVEQLGVVMRLVRDGVTRAEIDEGVRMWRRKNHRMGS
ncbi:magnesium-dependent phosphatase-1 [Pseudovirgaria hyperparasitica]|uniref:Magnesium-dependent phosphatase-1 n=1 Tax=Pseudovirgaria hyperparasitica TaxID=470096 RepID=A0A6A6VTI5_9PEZI|nr:magnesium-dependent phosphatase-1 [Pseudovirgaria hyperparasitica]KAF2753998.1 magnesium-dependent phosphatase-1 [Pseudovirgaria hyperparasitica]